MYAHFTDEERAVARALQTDLPLTERPFLAVARVLGMDEERVVMITKSLRERGVLRKFGAIVRHGEVGYRTNVMVVWAVPPERCDAVGRLFASFPAVSHCYRREPPFNGRYCIFTMIHSRQGEEELRNLIGEMARRSGIEDFLALPTREEFKKTSMEYF